MAVFKLLTTGNPKLIKGEKKGYLSFVLHLAPASLSGWNVCPMSTAGCRAACLNTAGRGGIMAQGETTNAIQRARVRRTKWFFEDRAGFMSALVKDVAKAIEYAKARDLVPCFRLNGTSDIRWEIIPAGPVPACHKADLTSAGRGKMPALRAPNIMELYPTVQFYDYTKIANRRGLPANYHLTFSAAEDNDVAMWNAFNHAGMNVAMVFSTPKGKALPAVWYHNVPVVDGDETDLRFLDPAGVIVGLHAKGKAKHDRSGFVRQV